MIEMEEVIMDAKEILEMATKSSFDIWFLIGAGWYSLCRPDSLWLRQDLPEQRMQVTLL